MAFKNILAIISAETKSPDLRAAIALSAAFHSHLSVVITGSSAPLPKGSYSNANANVWFDNLGREDQALDASAAAAYSVLEESGVEFDLSEHHIDNALPSGDFCACAHRAGLAVIGSVFTLDPLLRHFVRSGCLLNSACPLLVVPSCGIFDACPKTIVLAWDGSMSALHAVELSVDFMRSAQVVHVLLVTQRSVMGSSERRLGEIMEAYLDQLGVRSQFELVPSAGLTVAEAITSRAAALVADMIIMGAYGHSRLRDRLFGSVTKDMLRKVSVPLLMAH
jgi:nucleotide-binding universal stress UspA family protein